MDHGRAVENYYERVEETDMCSTYLAGVFDLQNGFLEYRSMLSNSVEDVFFQL